MGSLAAAVKPQVALYERHGSAGMAVLERTLAAAADAGVLTIADAKRGDIGSTMAAYADAWLRDGSSLAADSVTLSPYLGFESLRPALDLAARHGRGVFVLALTSNPEGASVQHVGGADSVARRITEAAAAENRRYAGTLRLGRPRGRRHRGRRAAGPAAGPGGRARPHPGPGLGAQGATAADLRATFGAAYRRFLGPPAGTSSQPVPPSAGSARPHCVPWNRC